MEWYYEHNGQQVGPVSRAEIIRLIIQRRIHPHTLVWTAEFGDQWRPAAKAGLIAPLSVKFMTTGNNADPSVPAEKADPAKVPSVWSWFILLPGLLNYLLYGLAVIRKRELFDVPNLGIFFIGMILITAVLQDRNTLSRYGYRPPTFLWLLLLGLCPPCYLWSRCLILKKGMAQAILAVIMWAGMAALGGYYLYQHPEKFNFQVEQSQGGDLKTLPWATHHEKTKQDEQTPSEKSSPEQKSLENNHDSSNSDEIRL